MKQFILIVGVCHLTPPICIYFPGGSVGKNLPVVQETQVLSLDREDPLEKKMATHSSSLVVLPGKSHGQKSLVGYSHAVTTIEHNLAAKPLPCPRMILSNS